VEFEGKKGGKALKVQEGGGRGQEGEGQNGEKKAPQARTGGGEN